MSFLDNLESNLKSLESQDERSPADNRRRDSERARTLAEAPWAARLKRSPYTQRLLGEATRAGHKLRAKVYIAWIDTTFRTPDLIEFELTPTDTRASIPFQGR